MVSGQRATLCVLASLLCHSAAVERAGQECAPPGDHILLQQDVTSVRRKELVGCVQVGGFPGRPGRAECCAGTRRASIHWGVVHYYQCVAVAPACTEAGKDPWATRRYVECCEGLRKELGQWWGTSHYTCRRAPVPVPARPAPVPVLTTSAPAPAPIVPSPTPASVTTKILEWNVHWKNRDLNGLAGVVAVNRPDIVGICELTASTRGMADALRRATGRPFKVQPGRGGFKGYGTDIFFDSSKWKAIEGGVATTSCSGSRGGKRAVNWVVLRDLASGRKLIAGGTHISYCKGGCDELHECELAQLYNRLEKMKRKHGNAPVVWMGDMNRSMRSRIMQNLLKGKLGGRSTFAVEDLAKTEGNTYYSGGSAIDHILGDAGAFKMVARGGRTGQGTKGRHLHGADHFPIYAKVQFN